MKLLMLWGLALTEPLPGMTRGETILLVWVVGALFFFIPYTATFGGLPDDKRRWPRVLLIALEVVWAVGWAIVWRGP